MSSPEQPPANNAADYAAEIRERIAALEKPSDPLVRSMTKDRARELATLLDDQDEFSQLVAAGRRARFDAYDVGPSYHEELSHPVVVRVHTRSLERDIAEIEAIQREDWGMVLGLFKSNLGDPPSGRIVNALCDSAREGYLLAALRDTVESGPEPSESDKKIAEAIVLRGPEIIRSALRHFVACASVPGSRLDSVLLPVLTGGLRDEADAIIDGALEDSLPLCKKNNAENEPTRIADLIVKSLMDIKKISPPHRAVRLQNRLKRQSEA